VRRITPCRTAPRRDCTRGHVHLSKPRSELATVKQYTCQRSRPERVFNVTGEHDVLRRTRGDRRYRPVFRRGSTAARYYSFDRRRRALYGPGRTAGLRRPSPKERNNRPPACSGTPNSRSSRRDLDAAAFSDRQWLCSATSPLLARSTPVWVRQRPAERTAPPRSKLLKPSAAPDAQHGHDPPGDTQHRA